MVRQRINRRLARTACRTKTLRFSPIQPGVGLRRLLCGFNLIAFAILSFRARRKGRHSVWTCIGDFPYPVAPSLRIGVKKKAGCLSPFCAAPAPADNIKILSRLRHSSGGLK